MNKPEKPDNTNKSDKPLDWSEIMSTTEPAERDWMTSREVGELLEISKTTLSDWRFKQIGPKFYKIGGAYRYPKKDVQEYLQHTRQTSPTA